MKPKAYSYLRFSTPEQMEGDSFRRQTEAAHRYAKDNGLDLDTELTFRDLGVSAFRGKNALEGALSQFIQAVDTGKVAPGSYLLVEDFDRLSRRRLGDAHDQFQALLKKEITVVTLSDGHVYKPASRDSLIDQITALLRMSLANEESEKKSTRLKEAWQNKRARAAEAGHILTGQVPGWLRVKRNGKEPKFEVVEARAAIVRRIFQETLEGHGQAAIAERLNREAVPTFGRAKEWHASYVQKIRRNEAVIGRYQPMRQFYEGGKRQRVADGPVIEGYFPAVVSEEDFYRVKQMKPGATGKRGYPLANVLSGLVYCSACGGRMHYVNKGKSPRGKRYFACDNARRKRTCNAKSVHFDSVVMTVLEAMDASKLSTYALMRQPKANRRQQLAQMREGYEARIRERETEISNLLDTLARVPSPSLEKRLLELETDLAGARKRLEGVLDNLRAAQSEDDAVEDIQDAMTSFWNSVASRPKEEQAAFFEEAHIQLNAGLKKLIDRIEVAPEKVTLKLRDIAEPQVLDMA